MVIENKVGYYSVVPAEVKYNTELTEKAKLIYGEISSLSNKIYNPLGGKLCISSVFFY